RADTSSDSAPTPSASSANAGSAHVPTSPTRRSSDLIEGAASVSQTVATFTDPGTPAGEILTDYSASIDWGDSSSSAGTISLSAGVFTVNGSHTYAEEGTKTVTVTLSHDGAPTATATSTATVSDPAVSTI